MNLGMKLSKNLKQIVLIIGIILIALRLFFPVKELQIFEGENRVSPSALAEKNIKRYGEDRLDLMEKTVVISKTIFQSVGIAVLIGGFILINELKRKQNP